MNPRHGEVWLVDMGMVAKTRPGVVLIADNVNTSRSLIIHIPITKQNRGSELEVPLGHLPFLDKESVANVQALARCPPFDSRNVWVSCLQPISLLSRKRLSELVPFRSRLLARIQALAHINTAVIS
jgi:mRNA interferase MazF